MTSKRVIIDTDPGVDDAHAIIFALLCDAFRVEAITTVHGNVDIETATRNALYLVETLGRSDIPVYRGAARALVGGDPVFSSVLHGEDGLGNTGLARPTIRRQQAPAVTALIDRVLAAPGEISLLVLGPHTNVALAVRAEPDFASAVKEIVFMGGRITPRTDTNPFVTFNIGEDAEAAHIVLQETEIPVTMLGQEVAMQVNFDPARLQRFADLNTWPGRLAAQISRYYISQQMAIMNMGAGSIPDLAVIAYALRPELFVDKSLWVDVDTSGGYMHGATISGVPSYRYSNLNHVLKGRPEHNKLELTSNSARPSNAYEQFGRAINVPQEVDHLAIADWYEQLLSAGVPE